MKPARFFFPGRRRIVSMAFISFAPAQKRKRTRSPPAILTRRRASAPTSCSNGKCTRSWAPGRSAPPRCAAISEREKGRWRQANTYERWRRDRILLSWNGRDRSDGTSGFHSQHSTTPFFFRSEGSDVDDDHALGLE